MSDGVGSEYGGIVILEVEAAARSAQDRVHWPSSGKPVLSS